MAQKPLKPIYYICGTDDYLIEEAVRAIRKEALTSGFESMNYDSFEGKGLDPSAVLSAASTMPAFSERRLVLVKDAGAIKAPEAAAFSQYFDDPCPSTTLVFVAEGKPVKTGALYKALSAKKCVEAYDRMSDRELAGWVAKEAKRQSRSITAAAALKLVAIAGTRLRDVKSELDKVLLYAGDKLEIDEKDVEDSGLDCREEVIFNLSDAIGAKDADRAFQIYEKLSGEAPLAVLGIIARQIRMLLKTRVMLDSGANAQAVNSGLKLWPSKTAEFIGMSRRFTQKELLGAMAALSDADTEFKSGRLPQSTVLPKLILKLCSKQ